MFFKFNKVNHKTKNYLDTNRNSVKFKTKTYLSNSAVYIKFYY